MNGKCAPALDPREFRNVICAHGSPGNSFLGFSYWRWDSRHRFCPHDLANKTDDENGRDSVAQGCWNPDPQGQLHEALSNARFSVQTLIFWRRREPAAR